MQAKEPLMNRACLTSLFVQAAILLTVIPLATSCTLNCEGRRRPLCLYGPTGNCTCTCVPPTTNCPPLRSELPTGCPENGYSLTCQGWQFLAEYFVCTCRCKPLAAVKYSGR
nr:uncharacterized protein LOC129385616 isoform X2 [Dermacentor andersoni]